MDTITTYLPFFTGAENLGFSLNFDKTVEDTYTIMEDEGTLDDYIPMDDVWFHEDTLVQWEQYKHEVCLAYVELFNDIITTAHPQLRVAYKGLHSPKWERCEYIVVSVCPTTLMVAYRAVWPALSPDLREDLEPPDTLLLSHETATQVLAALAEHAHDMRTDNTCSLCDTLELDVLNAVPLYFDPPLKKEPTQHG